MPQSPKNESSAGRTSRPTLGPLLRLSPIPMLRIHRGCLVDLNEAAMLLLDWDTGRIGLPIESLSEITLDAERRVDTAWQEQVDATLDGRGATTRWTFLRGDGCPLSMQMNLSATRDGCDDDVLALLQPDPEDPALQPQRLQAHRLELLGQLTGGIAHDFNNLLTAIDGHIELAGEALESSSSAAKSLRVASACARRAASLSRRLLEFHRTPTFDPRPIDPNGVIDDMVEFLAPLIRPNVTLKVEHGAELPEISVDRVQIQQALMNLVLNAQAAMPDGGTLWLRASEQRIDDAFVARYPWGKSGRYVRLEIEDTGVGIDPNDCENIFRPFFSARAGGVGTGLGLSIVYGIIKQHHGFIGVESAIDKGTLFWVLLPVDVSTCSVGLEPATVAQSEVVQRQALVLEDEVVVRQLAASILADDGFRVLEASSSAEALAQIESHGQIDLLVADVMINGGTAVEFVDRMRAQNPQLPVIYSSGYDPEQLNIDLHLDSRSLFLDKPYSLAQLRNAVKKVTANL